jgi:transaldolase
MTRTRIRPGTKVLLDGGDPAETRRIREMLGFLDGQTTNPSLVAKNPDIKRRIATKGRLTVKDAIEDYRRIVEEISPLVGDAGVSIEVFSDMDTTAKQMFLEGKEMFSWIPNAYVKYPCTQQGLLAARMCIREGIRVNITLCFSQEQAAAVYAATKGGMAPVYVSPFIGRLDDIGVNGIDLVRNIKRMYEGGDHHVHVLAASIRHTEHLLASFALGAELATAPYRVLQEWANAGCPVSPERQDYQPRETASSPLQPIEYQELDLNAPWESFDLTHKLTTKGIQTFVSDYESTLASVSASRGTE